MCCVRRLHGDLATAKAMRYVDIVSQAVIYTGVF